MAGVTDHDFESLVTEAIDTLPDEILEMMSNVEIVIEEEPPAELSAGLAPGDALLGYYHGVPLTGRGFYDRALPDKISIFKGPITRLARTPDRIREQVRVTVLHEIGHHFGIDEDRLHDLGYG